MRALPFSSSSFGLLALCALAVSVSMGVALVSLSLLLVLLAVLWQLGDDLRSGQSSHTAWPACMGWGLAALVWTAASWIWTEATPAQAAYSLSKHARWLLLPAVFYVLRRADDGARVLRWLVASQLFVVASSWLLWLGVELPWALAYLPLDYFTVFASTIEQPIMSTLMLLVVWFFPHTLTQHRHQRGWVWATVVLTSVNVLLLITGRSGHVAMLLALVIIGMGSVPRRQRLWMLLLPVVLVAVVGLSSERMQQRWAKAQSDVVSLYNGPLLESNSLGYRLDAWQKSVWAIAEKPLLGYGVGGWNKAYQDMGGTIPKASDPHQQFLLWAVESGLIGLVLWAGFFVTLWRQARHLPSPAGNALLSVTAVELVTGLMNTPLYGAGIGEFYLLLWGLLLAAQRHAATQPVAATAKAADNTATHANHLGPLGNGRSQSSD